MLKFCCMMTTSLAIAFMSACSIAQTQTYENHPKALELINQLSQEPGFKRASLQQLFSQVKRKDSILTAISRPAERTKTWGEYRAIFLTDKRIAQGVQFWQAHQDSLAKAEKQYGVPAQIIVAIIGVETFYGRITGNYRVIDALATLAFDYPERSPFFTKELINYLKLTRQEQIDPLSLKGSYAGAMGFGQFMPSSYLSYAIDFDGDNKRNIWTNANDAIGSVANYLSKHQWQAGELTVLNVAASGQEVAFNDQGLKPTRTIQELSEMGIVMNDPLLKAQQLALAMKLEGVRGEEYFIGLNNFYVITRYNRSRLYALAVYQLSQAIKQEMISR